MRINLAHIRERSTTGGWIDYAVFDARSTSGGTLGNQKALQRLVLKARAAGLKVDQAALAFRQNGQIRYFGSKNLVRHLSRSGHPSWTHTIDA